jgi:glycosyltransferase involved in cell wall biosynthesis
MSLISCIMPTRNRRLFVSQAILYFLRQDYAQKELIIIDDGDDPIADLVPQDERIRYIRIERRVSVGEKHNLGCQEARGELIAHWHDDDWMAPDRLSTQARKLLEAGADLCGVQELLFYHIEAGQAWLYRHLTSDKPWLASGTLLYHRRAWETHPFDESESADATNFIQQFVPAQVLIMINPSFYIALIHTENTTARNLSDWRWQRQPFDEVGQRLGEDREFYAILRNGPLTHSPDIRDAYLVSCIMPTYNRRAFVPKALHYFLRQDYPQRELIIVDDGTDPVGDLIPNDSRICYVRLPERLTIGEKRNKACEMANGKVIIFWDDDDWYAPNRISYQVMPILEGRADITCLHNSLMFWFPTGQFWACTSQLHERMFLRGIHGGTIAFWKLLWGNDVLFPDTSLAEDVTYVMAAVNHGARLKKLENGDTFFYVRHQANAWQFIPGEFLHDGGWYKVAPPVFVPKPDLAFYISE